MTGMLWFDDDPKHDLATKVGLAKAYYTKKFGTAPNIAYVNLRDLTTGGMETDGIRIIPSKWVLHNHVWMGVEQ